VARTEQSRAASEAKCRVRCSSGRFRAAAASVIVCAQKHLAAAHASPQFLQPVHSMLSQSTAAGLIDTVGNNRHAAAPY
jgi:hypothetical protein